MIAPISAFKDVFGFFLQALKLLKMNIKLCIMLLLGLGISAPIFAVLIQVFSLPFVSILISFYFFKNAQHYSGAVQIKNIWPLLKIRFLLFFYILWKASLCITIPGLVLYIVDSMYMYRIPTLMFLLPAAFAGAMAIFVFLFYLLRFSLVDYFVLFQNASFKTARTSSEMVMSGYKFAVFCLYIVIVLCMISLLYFLGSLDIDNTTSAIITLLFFSMIIIFGILLFNTTLYLLWNSKKAALTIDQTTAAL